MAASSRRFPPRSSLSARRVLRNLVAFALLYGAGLAAVWGFSLLGVSTLVAFPVFVLGVLIANGKQQAITDTKLDELTREVREHNRFAQRVPVIEEQIKVINHRIEDLEKQT